MCYPGKLGNTRKKVFNEKFSDFPLQIIFRCFFLFLLVSYNPIKYYQDLFSMNKKICSKIMFHELILVFHGNFQTMINRTRNSIFYTVDPDKVFFMLKVSLRCDIKDISPCYTTVTNLIYSFDSLGNSFVLYLLPFYFYFKLRLHCQVSPKGSVKKYFISLRREQLNVEESKRLSKSLWQSLYLSLLLIRLFLLCNYINIYFVFVHWRQQKKSQSKKKKVFNMAIQEQQQTTLDLKMQ